MVLFLSALILVVKLKLQYPAAAGALDGALGKSLLVYGNDIVAGGAGHLVEGLAAVPVAAASVMVAASASVSVAALVFFLFHLAVAAVVMTAALMSLAVLMTVAVPMAAFMLLVIIVVMAAAALVLVLIVHVEAVVVHIIVNYFLDGSQIVGHAVQLVAQVTDGALKGIHILRDRAENIYDSAYELFFLSLLAKGKTLCETLQICYLFSS